MAEKIALKRLGNSDLSFFDYHFRNKTFGDHRQKGINLNKDVFVDQLYPQAPTILGAKWPVLVTIFGPGAAGPYEPTGEPRRPITYNNGKNWRLNGGTVPDDPALPSRFHSLAPGDLALFRFRGDPAPDEVDVILVTASADGAAHNALDRLVPTGRRSMISLTPAQIEAALAGMTLPEGSPLAELEPPPEVEAAIEEVALGGSPEPALVGRRGGRRLTPAELAQARDDAQRIGADGETLLHAYLQQQMFDELEWVSQLDAAAPFDFRYRHQSGDTVKMDAKSTTGSFDRRIHVSTSEMLEASKPGARYVIARVYEIDDDGGKLRLCENFAEFARSITSAVALPSGVRIDGFSIDPSSLAWSNEIELVRSVADNNDD